VNLGGDWKITCEDNAEYSRKSYNDSDWDSIRLPGDIVRYSDIKTGKIRGIVWLRKTVIITGEHTSGIGLTFERIANADETYFNGIKVGSTGRFPPEEFSMWNHPRQYFIPAHLIRSGSENSIAIRISYNISGGVYGKLFLDDFAHWEKEKAKIHFTMVTLMYMAISMGILLLFIFLLFYYFQRQDEFLYYSLQIVCGIVIIFDLCTYWDIFPSPFVRLQISAAAWVGLNISNLFFTHRIYSFNRKKIELILKLLFVIWITLIATEAERKPVLFGTIFITTCIILGLYHISCHIYALYKKITLSKIFSLLGLITVITAMHDGLIYLSLYSGIQFSFHDYLFNRMIFNYGVYSFFIGTALVLVFRFLILTDEIHDLNRILEKYVIDDALMKKNKSGCKDRSYPVTRESEYKVKKVLEYIHKNYFDNLSREGLAAMVDMHPDNLSKHFNAQSKTRIGEYINKLRITDAAEKLEKTDENILNIAYSVGFESLRTFNRAFSRYMKTSPEKYRNASLLKKTNSGYTNK
jgi:AraC-like DNA-binding protein